MAKRPPIVGVRHLIAERRSSCKLPQANQSALLWAGHQGRRPVSAGKALGMKVMGKRRMSVCVHTPTSSNLRPFATVSQTTLAKGAAFSAGVRLRVRVGTKSEEAFRNVCVKACRCFRLMSIDSC